MNGVTAFNSRGYAYIVKNVESGSVTAIIPDNFENEESKQMAVDYINNNILVKKCERWPNEELFSFALRMDEMLRAKYDCKLNPDAH